MKTKDEELIQKVQEYLSALEFPSEWDIFYAMQMFIHTYFGLMAMPSTERVLELMDFCCEVEQVGPYDPFLHNED